MRLIDADALYKAFEDAAWYDNNDRDLAAEDILMDAPTIDPVRHGRWNAVGKNHYTQINKCSACGASYDFISNYCPNCGAKMDGAK